jgi:glycyl-tRNA synthetase beta chain
MVKEFPSLEGIIGGIYALKLGEKKEVSKAIHEHYNPKTPEDSIPQTKLGSILSILDKSYNIMGLLGLGVIPTGSYDPYSIRRQMHGVIKILSFNQIEIKLDELFDFFYNALESRLILDKEKLRTSFFEIAKDRFFNIMSEGIPQDLIKACINVNFQILFEVYLRMRLLLRIYRKRVFYRACKVVERTFKILRNFNTEKDVNTNLFSQEEEKTLWNSYIKNRESISNLIERRKYDEATYLYANVFYDTLDRFFDSVLVNVEDKEIRQNRKEMLYRINRLYTEKVANLQEMEVLKDVSK